MRKQLVLVVTAAVASASCGHDAAPITFDSVAPETSVTTPVTSSAPITSEPPLTVPGDVVGIEWQDATGDLAGLPSECGNLSYVSARPDRRGLIAGVALQGLWSSEDGGETWDHLGEGAGSDEVTLRLTDVQYDPEDPTQFWLSGMYTGAGVYQTSDDGTTFHQLGLSAYAEDVGVDFTDPARRTIVAPVHERVEVFRSGDGGATWQDITADLPDEGGTTVAVEVIDRDAYLVGTRLGRVPGIFRTDDAGETWTRVYTADVIGAPLRASNGVLYWLAARGTGLVASSDDGASWTDIPSSSISPFAPSLVELPDGRFVTVSDRTLIASADQGVSWRPLGPGLPYDPQGLLYSPFDGAFYIWHFDCAFGDENPIRSGAIMRLTFEPRPQ